MPTDGSGTYSLAGGYLAVSGQTIQVSQHNPIFQDVAQGLTDRLMADGRKPMTGLLTLSGDPVNPLQASTKQYVDASSTNAGAVSIKPSVLCATTANITLSGEQTLDGQLTSASRVLVKNQTAPAQNGIYVSAAGAWTRATDMAAWTNIPASIVTVQKGTLWAETEWLATVATGGMIGVTALTWQRIDNKLIRNAQTGTTYTVLADDHSCHLTFNNASAIAVTLPQATTVGLIQGFAFIAENLGAGLVTITPTTSTINGSATLTLATGARALIDSDSANYRALFFASPATNAVAAAGTDANQTITPSNLASVLAQGPSQWMASNLVIKQNSGTPTLQIDVSADRVTMLNASGVPFTSTAFAATITAALNTSGAINALDTGAPANNTAYDVWAVAKSDTTGAGIVLSLASNTTTNVLGATTQSNLNGFGYTSCFSMRLGTVITGGAATFRRTIQSGREVMHQVLGSGVTTVYPAIITGTSGAPVTPTWTGTVVQANSGIAGAMVPTKAKRIKVLLESGSLGGSPGTVIAAPNNNFGALSSANPPPLGLTASNTAQANVNAADDWMLETTSVYYASSFPTNSGLYCKGWTESVMAS